MAPTRVSASLSGRRRTSSHRWSITFKRPSAWSSSKPWRAACRWWRLTQFGWQHIVKAYENLWQSQEEERLNWCKGMRTAPEHENTPVCFPALEFSFAGYPTSWLGSEDWLAAAPGAERRLEQVLQLP